MASQKSGTEKGEVFVPPETIDPDQAYFWTPEWQKGEREASKDIAEGRVKAFDNIEDFIAEMNAR